MNSDQIILARIQNRQASAALCTAHLLAALRPLSEHRTLKLSGQARAGDIARHGIARAVRGLPYPKEPTP